LASVTEKLEKALRAPYEKQVYYIASTEVPLLRETAGEILLALEGAQGENTPTRLDGPAPDLDGVVASAGAISFFGTPRIVELREISPAAMRDKDVEELAALFGQLQNAVLVVTCLYKDKKTAASKKAKLLLAAAQEAGFALELPKPGRKENVSAIAARAKVMGTQFAPGAAEALLERVGEDRVLLMNEVEKLAAFAGYAAIDRQTVELYSVHSVEADVFQLAGLVCGGRAAAAQAKLAALLALRYDPLAVAAALSGSFVDMYRVRVGAGAGQPLSAVTRAFGYTGEYRLQMARENAARYSTEGLRQAVLCLAELDRQLKSSALSDKSVLLQAAVGGLMLLGQR
jgi:DNA polymerase-3 subunit delta